MTLKIQTAATKERPWEAPFIFCSVHKRYQAGRVKGLAATTDECKLEKIIPIFLSHSPTVEDHPAIRDREHWHSPPFIYVILAEHHALYDTRPIAESANEELVDQVLAFFPQINKERELAKKEIPPEERYG